MVANIFHSSISYFQSDGGSEYNSSQFRSFFREHGIIHRFSCPYTSAQNGRAERKHRHVNNQIRCLLFQASMPYSFWVDASLFGVHLINITPLPTLNFTSPYEKMYDKSPDYSLLKVFGCLCFPYVAHSFAHKFLPRSKACLFLDISPQHKEFKCLDPSTNRIILSRHVNFQESSYLYSSIFPANPSPLIVPSSQTTPPIFSPVQFPDMRASPINNFDFISTSDTTSSPSFIPTKSTTSFS